MSDLMICFLSARSAVMRFVRTCIRGMLVGLSWSDRVGVRLMMESGNFHVSVASHRPLKDTAPPFPLRPFISWNKVSSVELTAGLVSEHSSQIPEGQETLQTKCGSHSPLTTKVMSKPLLFPRAGQHVPSLVGNLRSKTVPATSATS